MHISPNGSVNSLFNLTRNFSYCVLKLGVAYKEDVEHLTQVLGGVGRELCHDAAFQDKILAPLEVLGVDDFAASAVVIRLRIKTVRLEKWAVGRALRRRIKNTFDAAGIELPYPQVSVHVQQSSQQPGAATGAGRDGDIDFLPDST